MKVLIVGGTSFVGRAIAWAAVESGHELTVINRGVTPSDLPSGVTHLIGDRQRDLRALGGHDFDVTVDVTAYRPRDVAVLHDALGGRGGHHIQISSISAYNEPPDRGAREDGLTLIDDPTVWHDAPVTAATYGALKAASERAAGELFGPVTIVRPTYVIGAHDTTLRFPYWVQRLRRGGTVAVPGPPTTTLQCIDARDLGHFVIGLATQHLIGAYHVTGPFPAPTFVDVIDRVARRVAPSATALVEVDPAAVDRHSLGEKFPLWPGPTDSTLNDLDAASAIAAGLTLRTVDESIDDVLAWWGDREWPREWLDPHEEDRLLADGASGAGAETTPTPR